MALPVAQTNGNRGGFHQRFELMFLVGHLAFQPVHVGDVAMNAQVAADVALGIHHRRNHQLRKITRAVLAPVHQDPGPALARQQALPHGLVDLTRRDLVRQHRLVAPDHLFAPITGHPFEGGVHIKNVRLRIGDGDGRGRLFHRRVENVGS